MEALNIIPAALSQEEVDRLAAIHPELPWLIERAFRRGYQQGAVATAQFDGDPTDLLKKIADWRFRLDPAYGSRRITSPPGQRDAGSVWGVLPDIRDED